MSLTPSTMLDLGTKAPDFSLPDTTSDNATVSLSDFSDANALLIMFICNHCPYVKHVQDELVRIANDYEDQGLEVVAISSNSVESHPQDGPEKMAEEAKAHNYPFPYLFDEDQEVAKRYRAACTPDFFLFDGDQQLVYRGQLDDSRPKNDKPVNGKDLRAAIEATLKGEEVPEEQTPSVGCNIKWKPGNEPDYFG